MEKDDNNFYTNRHEYNDKHTENTKTYGMEKRRQQFLHKWTRLHYMHTENTETNGIRKNDDNKFFYTNRHDDNYKYTENTKHQGKYKIK